MKLVLLVRTSTYPDVRLSYWMEGSRFLLKDRITPRQTEYKKQTKIVEFMYVRVIYRDRGLTTNLSTEV